MNYADPWRQGLIDCVNRKTAAIASIHLHGARQLGIIRSMVQDTLAAVAQVRCGRIGIAQADADHVTLLHYGKSGITSAIVSSAQLERWALRQLRETVFAAPEAATNPAEKEPA